jgi:uncharacterized protein YicC (UPF0701 family)
MPEYTAHELSEARQKQMVEDAVKEHCNPESENECQLVADKCRIKEELRKSRVHHTTKVQSKLP